MHPGRTIRMLCVITFARMTASRTTASQLEEIRCTNINALKHTVNLSLYVGLAEATVTVARLPVRSLLRDILYSE